MLMLQFQVVSLAADEIYCMLRARLVLSIFSVWFEKRKFPKSLQKDDCGNLNLFPETQIHSVYFNSDVQT